MIFEKLDKKIYLASPTMHGDELKYMQEAYDTNWMSTCGENIEQVEKQMAEKVGVRNAVALGCGTAALHLCVKLTGIGVGDYVCVSDTTFSATANPIVYEGATPVFVDIERETWNMDPVALEKALEKYPTCRVVIVANLYGVPAKMDELLAVCKKHNAVLIEDAAESFGATYKGKQTGSFGAYNTISFNGNKIITGSAGGVLLTDDDEMAVKARKWSQQSKDNAPWYQHTELGYNYRMSNVVAGVVRGQIPYLEEHKAKKKAIYNRYKEGLAGLPIKMNPYEEDKSEPNFWLSCIEIEPEAMCKQVRTDMEYSYESESGKSCPMEIFDRLKECNIESRPIWKPLHLQPYYGKYPYIYNNEEIGVDIFTRGLCLPSDIKITPEAQDYVIKIIRSCFD